MDADTTMLYCMLPIIFVLIVVVAYLVGRVQGPKWPTVWLGRWPGFDRD